MTRGILGKKLGMTQIFTDNGQVLPVTVVEVTPSVVIQIKTNENDGYNAVQLGYGAIKDKKVNSPMKGHFAKANVKAVRHIRELRVAEPSQYTVGQEIKADIFETGELIDVTGKSKGKGFAGVIKRHNYSQGFATHGSKSHREPGTTGPRMSGGGGKVFKGKQLPGRMGGERVTIQRLEVARIDTERNLILIKGAIPGPKGGLVFVKPTVKPQK